MKNLNKWLASALLVFASLPGAMSQQPYKCEGCSDLATRPVVNLSTLADANGNLLNNNTYLGCDKLYKLDIKLYVNNGQTLVIAPGTVIKALPSDATGFNSKALIVSRGGKLYAEGSECCPIIFTADADNLDGTYPIHTKEQWGGVIILGKAHNNIQAGEFNPENPAFPSGYGNGIAWIEGLAAADLRNLYGASLDNGEVFNNNDNSGVIKYVSIRHGGSEIGTANEINGLTLGSVGNGTILRNIEVISNGDDGIEFFGGTVDLKYAKILYCEDDYIDYDQGYTGRLQYILGVQRPARASVAALGDNGFECDGDDTGAAPRRTRSHYSDPMISNATILGNDATTGDVALELKEFTKGKFYNSIFSKFATGIKFNNASEDFVDIKSCTFVKMTTNISGTAPVGYNPLDAAKNNAFLNVSPNDTLVGMTNSEKWITNFDPIPAASAVKMGEVTDVNAIDPWFDVVTFRGAYNPSAEAWWSMKSCNGSRGIQGDKESTASSAFKVTTDNNNDGITDGVDLGRIIGNYNKTNDKAPIKD